MPQMAGPEFAFIMAALGRLRGGPDTAWLNRWERAGGGGRGLGGAAGRFGKGAGGAGVLAGSP